ncbi:ABC transporter permease [Streptococcus pneumoniae]
MNYASHREQILVYLGKFKRGFVHTKGWTTFISALVISLIACLVSGEEGFSRGIISSKIDQTSFIVTCACIWIGLFNSITLICQERDIVKHEYRSGMKLSAYIAAHMIFQALIVLVEALIVTGIILLFYKSDIDSLERFGSFVIFRYVAYFLTIFLTIYAADALGLLLSSIVKNIEQAMVIMPFTLLLQFLFSGQIELEGLLAVLTNATISRFSLDGLLYLASSKNKLETDFVGIAGGDPYPIFFCCLVLIIFSVGFSYLSMKRLKSVEHDTRD